MEYSLPDSLFLLALVFPSLGALGGALAARRAPTAQRWLTMLLCAIEIALVSFVAAPGAHRAILSDWEAGGITFAFEIDGATFLLLITLLAVPILLALVQAAPAFDAYAIFALNASIILLTAATPITVFFASATLDIAIFAWRMRRGIEAETATRSLAVGQIANIVFFAGAMLLLARFRNEGAQLIALALWGRAGLFPFHWLPLWRGSSSRDLWIARGAPLLAALNLWLHWRRWQADMPTELVGILAALALIGALLWMRQAEVPQRAVSIVPFFAAVLVPLVVAFGGDAALALGVWLTLGIAFSLVLFEIAMNWSPEQKTRWTRILWVAGLLALAGVPLTPAFLGQAGLYVSLWENGQGALLFLCAMTSLVVYGSVWRFGIGIQGSEPRNPYARERVALWLIFAAYFALPLISLPLGNAIGESLARATESALDRVIRTNNAPAVLGALALLFVPLLVSLFFALARGQVSARLDAILRALARLWHLDWFARPLAFSAYWMSALARNFLAMAEENPTVWILLIALWVVIFILVPR